MYSKLVSKAKLRREKADASRTEGEKTSVVESSGGKEEGNDAKGKIVVKTEDIQEETKRNLKSENEEGYFALPEFCLSGDSDDGVLDFESLSEKVKRLKKGLKDEKLKAFKLSLQMEEAVKAKVIAKSQLQLERAAWAEKEADYRASQLSKGFPGESDFVKNLKQTHITKLDDMRRESDQLEQKLNIAGRQKDFVTKQLKDSKEKNVKLIEKMKEFVETIKSKSAKIEEMKTEREASVQTNEILQSENGTLKANLKSLEREKRQLTIMGNMNESVIEKLKDRERVLAEEVKKMEMENSSRKCEVDDFRRNYSDLQSALKKAETVENKERQRLIGLSREKESEKEQFTSLIRKIKKENSVLEKEKKKLEKKNDVLEKEISTLTQQLKDVSKRLDKAVTMAEVSSSTKVQTGPQMTVGKSERKRFFGEGDLPRESKRQAKSSDLHPPRGCHYRHECNNSEEFMSVFRDPGNDMVKRALEKNSKFCINCYCYVCNVPVEECRMWMDTGGPVKIESIRRAEVLHCFASPDRELWVTARAKTIEEGRS